MKKLLGILVLGLLVSFNVEAASYLFKDNLYTDCDILTKKDPTTFQNISFVKEKKIKGWDKRKETSSGWKESLFKVFIFKATFEKSREINIRVNAEFETKDKAEEQAIKYGKMVGQLPNFLRKKLKTITIHKGNHLWAGGNKGDIEIYTEGYSPDWIECEEEVMIHEGGHVSLDWAFGGSVKSSKWKKAAKADNKFISKYAKEAPKREDVAETVLWWIAVRYKAHKISKSNYNKILEAIPNRLKYFDDQNYDMYPFLILNPNTLAIFCKVQGDCWDTMLEDYQQYLKGPPHKAWVTTRNIISKEFNANVWGWRTGGDSVMEVKVGANETCEKFKDSDDECVVVFRGNEFVDERIKKMFIDVNNGN